MSRLLILGCRPTLANVEAEVTAIAATAPGAELLLDPTAALAGQRTPHHSWCHFAGHADPKLGPDRVLVMCHDGGFGAVDASTLVDMLRTMKLVVLNGCKSEELAGSSCVKRASAVGVLCHPLIVRSFVRSCPTWSSGRRSCTIRRRSCSLSASGGGHHGA